MKKSNFARRFCNTRVLQQNIIHNIIPINYLNTIKT